MSKKKQQYPTKLLSFTEFQSKVLKEIHPPYLENPNYIRLYKLSMITNLIADAWKMEHTIAFARISVTNYIHSCIKESSKIKQPKEELHSHLTSLSKHPSL